uniref:Glucose-methanol-choline oxidoreductase N-terminal domain-containing protein n=1 Tax=Anopheles stephensi TaxID=30069 RepID=A0A182XXF3_ANOST
MAAQQQQQHFASNGAIVPTRIAKAAAAAGAAIKSTRTVYDFVVVGGGTAGSVIAARLAELQQWNILLVEAGDGPKDGQDVSWNVRAEPQMHACHGARDHRCEIPAGKGLGGNTLINNMLYVRGSGEDYDTWARQGNTEWSYRNLLPYFLKLENYRYNVSTDFTVRQQRGKGGPVPIFRLDDKSSLVQTFVAACNRFGLRTTDYNTETNQTVDYVQVTNRRGRRITATDAYIRPYKQLFTNLHIMTSARVTKVLINSRTKQAVGVKVLVKGQERKIRATKEVILSAGPIFTPQLLLLSGVGPKEQLDGLGIPVREDLPVGKNMNLRFVSFPIHLATNRTLPSAVSPKKLEAIAFLNTAPQTNPTEPSHEILFQYEPKDTREYFSLGLIHLKPASKGFLKLSTTNPSDNPLVYTNFLSDPNDIEDILRGIKECLKHLWIAVILIAAFGALSANGFFLLLKTLAHAGRYINEHYPDGPLTVPGGVEAISFIRTANATTEPGVPNIAIVFSTGSLVSDGGLGLRKGKRIKTAIYNKVYRPLENVHNDQWTASVVLLHPESRGHLKLRSVNPYSALKIYPGYFNTERDIPFALKVTTKIRFFHITQ